MRPVLTTAVLLGWLLTAALASAQSFHDEHINIGAGGGIANPLHGDFTFTAPTWHVSFRGNPSRFLSFEVFYGEWRRKETAVYTNITGPVGMPGLIWRIGRLEQETLRVTKTAGVNVLLRYVTGRAAFWGGGGPAFMDFARTYRQRGTDCQGPAPCEPFTNTHGSGAFAMQLTGGADVAITRRVYGFGQLTVALPADDPGSGHVAYTGGVRVAIW